MRPPWWSLLKHQVVAIGATATDFSIMIACVELGRLSPVAATALGAASGAVTNFTIGRRWVFRATARPFKNQAAKYGVVSAGSLALNSLGEYVFQGVVHIPYVAARILVAALVGVLWNFPMQRYFVFRVTAGQP